MRRGSPLGPFVLRLVVFWCAGFVLVTFVPWLERFAIGATIECLVPCLRLVFPGVQRIGDQVGALGVTFQIVADCTPLVPLILLWGAIGAFPAPGSARVVGVIAGTVVLWVYNLVRILVLIVVEARWPRLFNLAHVYLWQTMTLVVLVGVFIVWLRRTTPPAAA